jgi:hypothetical protein
MSARRVRPGVLALLLLVGLFGTGCLEQGFVSVGGPLSLSLSVDQAEVSEGTAHVFRVEARGQQLLGLILDYGDGQVDSVATAGAQSATHVEVHQFGAPGTYRVRARVEDLRGLSASDSLDVRVRLWP